MIRGYESVERFFIDGNSYIASDTLSLSDFFAWTDLLVLDLLIPIDPAKFPKLKSYLKWMESHKSYTMNIEGALNQFDFIEKCLQKAKNYKINKFELVSYPKPI